MISQGWKLFTTTLFCLVSLISAPLVHAQSDPQTVKPVEQITPTTVTGVAQTVNDSAQTPPKQETQVNVQDLQIGPGDLLELRVFGVQDLTQDVRVSANGDVNLALIGMVHLAGLTQTEAEAAIATKFKEGGFLNDPHISVFTKEYATQGVSVMGEVTKPSVYALMGPRRLFDVISLAGGD